MQRIQGTIACLVAPKAHAYGTCWQECRVSLPRASCLKLLAPTLAFWLVLDFMDVHAVGVGPRGEPLNMASFGPDVVGEL
jgi:hypothetical protein